MGWKAAPLLGLRDGFALSMDATEVACRNSDAGGSGFLTRGLGAGW
ncbi:hypothetical protein [Dyella sp. 20L07]